MGFYREIDLMEEENGVFDVYEFKFNNNRKISLPKGFDQHYNVEGFYIITQDNWCIF